MRAVIVLLLWFSVFAANPVGAQTVPPELISYPDTILHNGKIATMDDQTRSTNPGTIVQAVAIREGKIVATGNNRQILAMKGPQTKIIDLKGRTVVPGIIDTHSHLFDYALDAQEKKSVRTRLRAQPGETWESIKKRTLEAVKEMAAKKKPGEWIALDLPREGIGSDGKLMNGIVIARRGFIHKNELDQLAPNNPVYIKMRTTCIINTKAMDLVKTVWAGPMEPDLIREDGFASNTLNRIIGSDFLVPTLEELAQYYKEENLRWASYGVTTWSSSMRSNRALAAYKLLDQKGEIGIRFAYTPSLGTPIQGVPEMHGVHGYGTDYVWFVGASTRGTDQSYPGILTTITNVPKEIKDREVFNAGLPEFIEDAVARGLRIAGTHTAGDKAADVMLEAIEKGSARAGFTIDQIRARGHALDHCALNPRPDQIPRLQKLNITMSCAPKYIADSPEVLKDYGEQYLTWIAPVKSLIDSGVKTVLEIDDRDIFKVGTAFHYIDAMVNREVEGKVYAGRERVDRVIALKTATSWAAEYVLRQNVLGTLERGKYADLLVLNADYFTVPEKEIKKIRPLMTMVGGKIVYQAQDF
ncbi:MAG TPA: amidohydrolase family protein [Candidatus Acidoferrales bacterium]|nr:amidohydrolase family protein [Candidatus Acidoferrales bacterium]